MSSFGNLNVFPAGYFRSTARWLLNERRDLTGALQVLSAEIARIGFIRILYKGIPQPDGGFTMSEERIGVSVTPNTTLERLVRAYIATGGNPYDISPFMMPDLTEVFASDSNGSPALIEKYPKGGVVAPKTVDYDQANGTTGLAAYEGGNVDYSGFYPVRQGGQTTQNDLVIARSMHQMRGWANQAIKEKLQNAEWRIIKQMDLREQLMTERDETLVQAFGGTMMALPFFDITRFDQHLRVQGLVDDMNQLIFETDGTQVGYRANPMTNFQTFVFADVVSEHRDALG